MRLLILVPALVLAACNATSHAADTAGQSGASATQRTFDVGEFHSVALGGSNDVIVQVGGARSIRAEGAAEALDRLDIHVENGVLKIGQKHDSIWSGHRVATVYVTAPALDGASVGGSGSMRIDSISGRHFDASVGGSGNLSVGTVKVDDASFSLGGSGNLKAAGAASSIKVSVAGSGDLDVGALDARNASVSLAGSGDAVVRASDNATLSLIGSGDITVHGTAKCSVSKMGSGDARCLG